MKLPAITPLNNLFTDREAWFLFRWSAILETVGWTMLIIGIVFQITRWPGNGWVLPIGASLHGMFVIAYMGVIFGTHRSFTRKWTTLKMLIAELINIIPYAVLVFALCETHRRQKP
ncbi:MAG TPA: DUF3817 domain-containing protein [Candidatus Saccharimonadaceae bacterium]|nr:DUF3817 domain-containing protein [Candidatus Saccharimonadaceae bacterium]